MPYAANFVIPAKFREKLHYRLLWHPEDHAGFFPQFCRKFLYAAIFHAGSHAMLNACGFEAFFGKMGAQDASFGWEWEIGKIRSSIRKLLFYFEYFDAADARLMIIFLGAGQFAGVAPGAIFIVNEQTIFRLNIFHMNPEP
jgi:hypothetical protein